MDNCIRPPTRTVVPPKPHASRGIGEPYPKEYREQIMFIHDNCVGAVLPTWKLRTSASEEHPSSNNTGGIAKSKGSVVTLCGEECGGEGVYNGCGDVDDMAMFALHRCADGVE